MGWHCTRRLPGKVVLVIGGCLGEFDPHQRLQLFPCARNVSLIAQYWLVQGMELSVINIYK